MTLANKSFKTPQQRIEQLFECSLTRTLHMDMICYDDIRGLIINVNTDIITYTQKFESINVTYILYSERSVGKRNIIIGLLDRYNIRDWHTWSNYTIENDIKFLKNICNWLHWDTCDNFETPTTEQVVFDKSHDLLWPKLASILAYNLTRKYTL